MNWNTIDSIFDGLTKQTSITRLNSLGLKYCRQLLSNCNYRIYLNHHLCGNDSLDLAFANGPVKPTEAEIRLSDELGKSKNTYPVFFEGDDVLNVLVINEGYCLALVVIDSGKQPPAASQIEILKTITKIWSNQLDVLYYYQRDVLTGLYNPNIFVEAVNGNSFYSDETVEKDIQDRPPIERRDLLHTTNSHCIALIDIDDFKTINERFGHTIGDEVLIKLSRLMELSFRESDLLCRYGGEEFAVLLRYVSKSTVDEVLKRFRQRVLESHFPRIDKLTVSIGFTMTVPGILVSELLDRADGALSYAKDNGKDQIISSDTVMRKSGNWSAGNASLEVGEIELF